MSDKSKSPAPTTGRLHGGRTSSAGKSRLAALAPGEHLKEKQVGCHRVLINVYLYTLRTNNLGSVLTVH